MTTSAPPEYEQLLDTVLSSLDQGDVVSARRHLVRARTDACDDAQMLGAVMALELVCTETTTDSSDEQLLEDLHAHSSAEPLTFANAVGCTLSDAGDRLAKARLLRLADSWFRHVTALARDAITFANHGVVLDRLERFEEAVAAYSAAMEIDPELDEMTLRLARAASSAGDHSRAVEAYRAYLATHPTDAHEWISLAIELSDLARMEDAEQAYWRAAGLEPENLSLHFNWMITARRIGDPVRTQRAANKLKALAPADWRTRVAESHTLSDAGDIVGAFRVCRELLRDLLADPDAERWTQEYVASQLADSVFDSREELASEIDSFLGDVFVAEIFTAQTLKLVRALERAKASGLLVYTVLVEALYDNADPPFACIVNFEVLAPEPTEAAELARQFERRCGASDTRVAMDDLVQRHAWDGPGHPGILWRSGRNTFPVEQFGTDE